MEVYFLTSNQFKFNEVNSIIGSDEIKVIQISRKINEIQSSEMDEIVRDKALKAFRQIGRNVLVEQTGLLIKDFGNLPGGLTQICWDSLNADRFGEIFSKIGTAEAVAKTVLGYCDGKHTHVFDGQIEGKIVTPRGNRDFQWDCVFEPKGFNQTFAEMGNKKNDISMRRLALNKFKVFLEGIKDND